MSIYTGSQHNQEAIDEELARYRIFYEHNAQVFSVLEAFVFLLQNYVEDIAIMTDTRIEEFWNVNTHEN